MRFHKGKLIKTAAAVLAVVVIATTLLTGLTYKADAQTTPLDPKLVRSAVQAMGMDSLSKVILTDPPRTAYLS